MHAGHVYFVIGCVKKISMVIKRIHVKVNKSSFYYDTHFKLNLWIMHSFRIVSFLLEYEVLSSVCLNDFCFDVDKFYLKHIFNHRC